jgi:hypothetical protein
MLADMTIRQPADGVSACQPPSLADGGYLLLETSAFVNAGYLSSLPVNECRPINWGRDKSGLPVLVDLAQCNALQREWLALSIGEEHDNRRDMPLMRSVVCAYLDTPVGLDEIATCLADRLLVLPVHKNGNRSLSAALWRFFDPRVFANLCWMLEPSSLDALTAPLSRWVFPWFGNWLEFNAAAGEPRMPEMEQDASQQERIGDFARIDIDTWERAQRIPLINQVLARLDLPPELSWQLRAAAAFQIESALIVAERRLRWDRPEDQIQYAEHAVRHGPAFLEHRGLVEYWARLEARTVSMSCSEVIASLPPGEYEAFSRHALDSFGALPETHSPNKQSIRRT